jgi:hypothetical protein
MTFTKLSNQETYLTIHADGRIEVSENLQPSETAALVLECMKTKWMADAQSTKIREYQARIKRLEEALTVMLREMQGRKARAQSKGGEMNIEETKEAIKVMQAFVDGKEVEAMNPAGNWETAITPRWGWDDTQYRIKPTATLRPWTAGEVPLGAQVRSKSYHPDHRSMIIQSGNSLTREGWLTCYEHSIDCGKTWLPCGVMEESK